MSRKVQLVAPDRLRIREGGGCMALFGLPFFAAGVGLLLAAASIIPMQDAGQTGLQQVVVSLLGIVFTAVGGTLAFGRTWMTIDASARTVVRQAGPLVPLTTHTVPLDGYTHVVIRFARGDSDTSDSFPVALKGPAGADLPIMTSAQYGEARDCAAAVAKLLNVEIEDASTDHPIRLTPADAGAASHDAAWIRRAPSEGSGRPDGAVSEVGRETEGVRIVIPLPRAHPIGLALGLLPAAIAIFFVPALADFFRRTRTPDPVAWTFLAFIGLFFVVFPTTMAANGWLRSRRGATIVFVSPRGVRIQERGAWRTRARASIDIRDLLDVDYGTRASLAASARRDAERRARASHGGASVGPRTERLLAFLARHGPGGGVVLKTRDGLATFGEALPDEEIQYLYGVVLSALRG